MNLKTASDLFKNLMASTTDKSEIRVYEKFTVILTDLKNRDITGEQLRSIEEELDALHLNERTENDKKYFKKKLSQFIKYLKENLSLISEGYYSALGTSLGLSFGVAFGAAFDSISNGLIFGMLFGLIAGRAMDAKAKKEGRVLKTKLD